MFNWGCHVMNWLIWKSMKDAKCVVVYVSSMYVTITCWVCIKFLICLNKLWAKLQQTNINTWYLFNRTYQLRLYYHKRYWLVATQCHIYIQYWSVDGKYRIYLTRLRNGVEDELLASLSPRFAPRQINSIFTVNRPILYLSCNPRCPKKSF
jgi:hypothetical protein